MQKTTLLLAILFTLVSVVAK